jgi:hypothetical protein
MIPAPSAKTGGSGAEACVHFGDASRSFAERPELTVGEVFPTAGNGHKTALFIEGFKGQPAAAIALGKSYSPLTDGAPVGANSTLDARPWNSFEHSAIRVRHSPLDPARLRIPHLPICAVSVYECPVCHRDLYPHADSTRGCANRVAGRMPQAAAASPKCMFVSAVYLAKLASVSLMTSIMDLAVQRSLPL